MGGGGFAFLQPTSPSLAVRGRGQLIAGKTLRDVVRRELSLGLILPNGVVKGRRPGGRLAGPIFSEGPPHAGPAPFRDLRMPVSSQLLGPWSWPSIISPWNGGHRHPLSPLNGEPETQPQALQNVPFFLLPPPPSPSMFRRH